MATIREFRFFCEKCAYEFSIHHDWREISGHKPKCAMCKSNKKVYRNYFAEQVGIDTGPKTVGSLADKNAQKGIKNEQEEKEHKASYRVEDGRAKRI